MPNKEIGGFRAQDTDESVFLKNESEKEIGYRRIKTGVRLAVGGVVLTLFGGGLIGIPASLAGGYILSSGVDKAILKPRKSL